MSPADESIVKKCITAGAQASTAPAIVPTTAPPATAPAAMPPTIHSTGLLAVAIRPITLPVIAPADPKFRKLDQSQPPATDSRSSSESSPSPVLAVSSAVVFLITSLLLPFLPLYI